MKALHITITSGPNFENLVNCICSVQTGARILEEGWDGSIK